MSDTQKIKSAFEDGVLQDFYQLLGVDFGATNEEIKKGYHTELKIHHPDCPNGDAVTMRRIMLAYKTLSDPVMRSVYNIFYNELINRKNDSQDASVESTIDHETVMQEFSDKSSKSKEAFTQDVSQKSTKSKESVQSESLNKPSSMNGTSCYTKSYMNSIKKRGTSYHFKISPNAIRNILRKHHYSEKTIDNFLLWCQEHHMKITSGKELHSVFLKYLSMAKEMKETETARPKSKTSSNLKNKRYHLRRDNYYRRKTDARKDTRKESHSHITFHFPFQRELKACQTFVKGRYISSIRNLQIFDIPTFVTLIHTIQNVTVFLSENRNHYRKRDIKVKAKHY